MVDDSREKRGGQGGTEITNGNHVAEAKYAVKDTRGRERASFLAGHRPTWTAFPYEIVPLPNMVHRGLLHHRIASLVFFAR